MTTSKIKFSLLKDKGHVSILQINKSHASEIELNNIGTVKKFKDTILKEFVEECSPNESQISLHEAFELWNNEPGLKSKTFYLIYNDGKTLSVVEED